MCRSVHKYKYLKYLYFQLRNKLKKKKNVLTRSAFTFIQDVRSHNDIDKDRSLLGYDAVSNDK